MLELGTDELAKYPFLEGAGKFLKDKGFPLSQFGTDPDLKSVLIRHIIGLKFLLKAVFTNLKLLVEKHLILFVKKKFFHFF